MNARLDTNGAEHQGEDVVEAMGTGCWLLTVCSLSAIVAVGVVVAVWNAL